MSLPNKLCSFGKIYTGSCSNCGCNDRGSYTSQGEARLNLEKMHSAESSNCNYNILVW